MGQIRRLKQYRSWARNQTAVTSLSRQDALDRKARRWAFRIIITGAFLLGVTVTLLVQAIL